MNSAAGQLGLAMSVTQSPTRPRVHLVGTTISSLFPMGHLLTMTGVQKVHLRQQKHICIFTVAKTISILFLLFCKATLDALLLRKATTSLQIFFITWENVFSECLSEVPSPFPAFGSCQQAASQDTSGLSASSEECNQLQMFRGGCLMNVVTLSLLPFFTVSKL